MISLCIILWLLGCFNTFLLATIEGYYGTALKCFISAMWPCQVVVTIFIVSGIWIYEKVTGNIIRF